MWRRNFQAFIGLLFPRLCPVCGRGLTEAEKFMCTFCLADFPLFDENLHGGKSMPDFFPSEERFLVFYSLFYYSRDGKYKNLIYEIKYKSRKKLGFYLGKMLGERLVEKVSVDAILPIPLHPRRQKKRGFNQARQIALGMGEVLKIPVWDDVLKRLRNNVSQTGLSAEARLKNTEHLFQLQKNREITGKQLLLVDDVVTTGATVRACIEALQEGQPGSISLACLARTLL